MKRKRTGSALLRKEGSRHRFHLISDLRGGAFVSTIELPIPTPDFDEPSNPPFLYETAVFWEDPKTGSTSEVLDRYRSNGTSPTSPSS